MQTLLGCLLVFLVLLQQDGSCVQELMAKEWRRGPASSIAHSTLLILIYAGNTAPHPFTLGDCQDSPAMQEAAPDQAQTGGLVYVALATRKPTSSFPAYTEPLLDLPPSITLILYPTRAILWQQIL